MRITGAGLAGSPFRLLASTQLSAPRASWTVLTNSVFDPDGKLSFTDTGAAAIPARFYQVSIP
jgi:hypothetical protein